MELNPLKQQSNLWRHVLVRALSFGVLILAIRFAYLIAVKGRSCDSTDFCFFSHMLDRSDTVIRRPDKKTKEADGEWTRKSIHHYSSVFQTLIARGYLSTSSKSLCLMTLTGSDIVALREIGVSDAVGIAKRTSSAQLVPFDGNVFDFIFTDSTDQANRVVEFASEVCRTLKPDGFFVIHTVSRDVYSLNSVVDLFNCCRLITLREINGVDSRMIREIVLKKDISAVSRNGNAGHTCAVSGLKREIIRKAEPLIGKEPTEPWITLKRNLKNIMYLTSMVDISFKGRYVYIDIGARSFGSSIGSWFRKQYPKQNKTFEIYAVEADKAFHDEYKTRKGVTLLPYAAWVRNETLFFGISRDPGKRSVEKGRGMGRIHNAVQSSTVYNAGMLDKIEGFDLASWLKRIVTERDFVVVKMDIEGTEFHVIPRLIETGAMCLIDEMFIECHYNRWQKCCPGQRSPKFSKTYDECLQLFTSLRKSGVLVHQWW